MEANEIEFWRSKANMWHWLFEEEKKINEGFKKLVKEYKALLGIEDSENKVDNLSEM